jgi:hypothetical protein
MPTIQIYFRCADFLDVLDVFFGRAVGVTYSAGKTGKYSDQLGGHSRPEEEYWSTPVQYPGTNKSLEFFYVPV